MLNIGIDLFACDSGKSGISQYMINLLNAFDEAEPDNRYTLFLAEEDSHIFQLPPERFHKILIKNIYNRPALNLVWHQINFPRLLKQHRLDVLFMPAANRRLTWYTGIPTVGTIHDLCQFRIENKYDGLRMLYVKKLLPLLAKRLTKIITPSQSSKDDVIHFYGIDEQKIQVIYNGINHHKFFPMVKTDCRAMLNKKYFLDTDYILYLSRLEHPGKNHIRLIEAYHSLIKSGAISQKLLLLGAPWNGFEAIYAKVSELGLKEQVIFPGFIPGDDLPLFVGGADLFVYPSLYEGFGIPVIEAMAAGVPVICSGVSSLPEIVGDSAFLFDPLDPQDIANKMLKALANPELAAVMRARGINQAKKFNWDLAARQTLSALEAVR